MPFRKTCAHGVDVSHPLQGAQRANLWSGMLRGALRAVSSSSSAAKSAQAEAERCSERLLAALQLGNACLALSAAESSNGRPGEAAAALRSAVGQLRWVLAAGGEDLQRLGGTAGVEVRWGGCVRGEGEWWRAGLGWAACMQQSTAQAL
jgi:hypothetical protein